MARTVHRNPLSVSTDPGIDYKFFAISNWSGLCSNKNLLNVNQETFEDCNNVYVDENGLLKSRPSLKPSKYESALNFWKFDDIIIKLFYEHDYILSITNGTLTKKSYLVDEQVKILKYGDEIFVFTSEGIYFIDDVLELQPADDLIYNPIRYTFFNDVRSKDVNETDNILISSYRESYLYNGISKISNPTYRDKPVTITIDGRVEKYDKFEEGREDLLFFHKFSINNSNYIDGHLLLDVSDAGNMILSSWEMVNDKRRWTIKHSLNGTTFEEILSPDGDIMGLPIISKDGTFVVVFKTDGPYALSLVNDANGTRLFNKWTNLLAHNEVYDELNLNIPVYDNGNINDVVNGVFYNSSTFFIATSNTPIDEDDVDLPFVMYGIVDGEVTLRSSTIFKAENFTPNIKVVFTNTYHMLTMVIIDGILRVYDVYDGSNNSNHDTHIPVDTYAKRTYQLLEYDVIKLDDESVRFTYDKYVYEGNYANTAYVVKSFNYAPKFLNLYITIMYLVTNIITFSQFIVIT